MTSPIDPAAVVAARLAAAGIEPADEELAMLGAMVASSQPLIAALYAATADGEVDPAVMTRLR